VEEEMGLALLLGVADEPRRRRAAGIRGAAQTLARVRRRHAKWSTVARSGGRRRARGTAEVGHKCARTREGRQR
jgi:hypothetical protein